MFAEIQGVLNTVAGLLWGWPMLIFLMGTGIWLTFVLKGLQFRELWPALWEVVAPSKGEGTGAGTISNRSALFTALAATVGTGNIAGVATAIALGGPGAMFWMWMSGLLGMALKYSETLLGVHYRVKAADGSYRGGPMYYLKATPLPWLAPFFALCLAFAALSIGGMVQSNSMADAFLSAFGFNPTIVGACVTLAAAAVMFGGLKRIAKVADWLVPFMIVFYGLAGTLILLANAQYIPGLIGSIFADAFTGTAAAGGFAGSTIMIAMRYGLARGVFANESGLGSAPIVAATAKTKHPVEQALISMTQTFIDTFFVCTFTGLVILITGAWLSPDVASGGASLTSMAFNSGLGGISLMGMQVGSAIVALALFLFAFTTILGWGYYGQQGAVYLFGAKVAKPYLWFFLLCTFFGAQVLDLATSTKDGVIFIWLIADIATGLMMLPNLFGLCWQTKKIRALTVDYIRVRAKGGLYAIQPFVNDVPVKAAAKAAPAKVVAKAKTKPKKK